MVHFDTFVKVLTMQMIIAVCQAYRTELSSFEKLEQLIYISETEIMHFYLGPVSQR